MTKDFWTRLAGGAGCFAVSAIGGRGKLRGDGWPVKAGTSEEEGIGGGRGRGRGGGWGGVGVGGGVGSAGGGWGQKLVRAEAALVGQGGAPFHAVAQVHV